MNDNFRRHFAILNELRQGLGTMPGTHADHHVRTLAALVSGLIGSKNAQLPAVAAKARWRCQKTASRERLFTRWLKRKNTTWEAYFLPFAKELIASLPSGPLFLVMDGSEVGRGCVALMLAVVYQGRALPLAWNVITGKKGHFPEASHIALLEQAHALFGPEQQVIFLGDGEFDGIGLLETINKFGWKYVCRTAKNALLTFDKGETWTSPQQLADEFPLKPGDGIKCKKVLFTAKAYGPVQVAIAWDDGCKEPIFLVTNLADIPTAYEHYKKRFRIETFFSDQKSRGFQIRKSHLSDPERLARLLIATCLAYYWLVFLGDYVVRRGLASVVDRRSRRDLSLFQIGYRWFEFCLQDAIPILTAFRPSPIQAQIYVR